MEENDARTLLREMADAADTQAPPARVNLRQAMVAGRRQRRIRLAGVSGSALAISAAAGAVVAMTVVPGPRAALTFQAPATAHAGAQPTTGAGTRPARGTSAPHDVPTQFNPLMPYASFGWLPAGSRIVKDFTSTSSQSTALSAAGPAHSAAGAGFWLHVMSTGACRDSGTVMNCRWDSIATTGPLPLSQRAPDVNGRPAYWTEGDSLLWEYASGAWATLLGPAGYNSVPTPAERALTLRVARGVRYGYQAPLAFPFWVTGTPASWHLTGASFTDSLSDAPSLTAGPSLQPRTATIGLTPSGGASGCPFLRSVSRYVMVHGVKAVLQASSSYQSLCITNLDGWQIDVELSLIAGSGEAIPGAAAAGGAVGLAEHLHLLGQDPASWTTRPLR